MKNTVRHALAQGAAVLLLVALAIAPAKANFIYSLDVVGTTVGDFVLTVPSLISVDTTFAFSAFDSISPFPGSTSLSFVNPLGPSETEVLYNVGGGSAGFFWISHFTGPGTYCAGSFGCGDTAAIMTITETSAPEPTTLALLGLAFAGLGATRRRKLN